MSGRGFRQGKSVNRASGGVPTSVSARPIPLRPTSSRGAAGTSTCGSAKNGAPTRNRSVISAAYPDLEPLANLDVLRRSIGEVDAVDGDRGAGQVALGKP